MTLLLRAKYAVNQSYDGLKKMTPKPIACTCVVVSLMIRKNLVQVVRVKFQNKKVCLIRLSLAKNERLLS